MTYTDSYRHITGAWDEDDDFQKVLGEVARFWTDVMHAQPARDHPTSRIKYSRDWEWPWTVIKSHASSGCKLLDCGAGYSPLSFIWASRGAEVHAIDRDAVICSRPVYAIHCLGHVLVSALRPPLVMWRRFRGSKATEAGGLSPAMAHAGGGEPPDKGNPLVRVMRFLRQGIRNRYPMFRRIWKPDTWGPIPPRMLREYGVSYRKGDLADLPYEDGYFDVVSCISVLEHMPIDAQIRGVREMARVVKPGGKLIITYDKYEEDLTDRFIGSSGLVPEELVYLARPETMCDTSWPDIVGICLVKSLSL